MSRMVILKKGFHFILFVIVAGCALPRAGLLMPDGSTVYEIYPQVEFIDHERQPVKIDHPPKDIVLFFPYIPGQVNGSFNTAPLQTTHVTEGSVFRLDLGRMSSMMDRAIAPLKNTPYTEGITIDPASTQFARVATLAIDAETRKGIGGSSFIDAGSREYLILVYVDRPCSLTGSTHVNSYGTIYDVRLGRPGFHWLRAHPIGKRSVILKEHAGDNKVFFSIEFQRADT